MNLDAGPIRAEGESLRPLDNHNGLLSQRVFQPKRFQIVKIFHAIEVNVIDLAVIVKHVNQREGGAGDILFPGGSQTTDDSLGQRGFPAAQVSAQQDKNGRAKLRGDFAAFRNGFVRWTRDRIRLEPTSLTAMFPFRQDLRVGFGNRFDQVRSNQRRLPDARRGNIAREAMQVHPKAEDARPVLRCQTAPSARRECR